MERRGAGDGVNAAGDFSLDPTAKRCARNVEHGPKENEKPNGRGKTGGKCP